MRRTIITILILLPLAYSFNFGTVPKSDFKTIQQGQSTQFTILLWNLGESSYPVEVEMLTDLPGWDIIVRPQNFILDPTPIVRPPYGDGEYMQIPNKGIVEVETLRVFVKTPDYVEPGFYELILVAKAGNLGDQVSVLQERHFRLRIEVKESPTLFEETYESVKLTGEKIVESGNEVANAITGMATKTPNIIEKTYESIKQAEEKVAEKGEEVKKTITGVATKGNFNPLIALVGGTLILSFIIVFLVKHKRSKS